MLLRVPAFRVSSLKDPPLNVKQRAKSVFPFFFPPSPSPCLALALISPLASNVEASYQRKGNSPNGTERKTSEQRAPGSSAVQNGGGVGERGVRGACLLASTDRRDNGEIF